MAQFVFVQLTDLMEIQGLHIAATHFIRHFCHILICVICSQMLQCPLLMLMPADNQQMVQCYRVPSSKSSQLPEDIDTIMRGYPEKGDVSVNISERAGV